MPGIDEKLAVKLLREKVEQARKTVLIASKVLQFDQPTGYLRVELCDRANAWKYFAFFRDGRIDGWGLDS